MPTPPAILVRPCVRIVSIHVTDRVTRGPRSIIKLPSGDLGSVGQRVVRQKPESTLPIPLYTGTSVLVDRPKMTCFDGNQPRLGKYSRHLFRRDSRHSCPPPPSSPRRMSVVGDPPDLTNGPGAETEGTNRWRDGNFRCHLSRIAIRSRIGQSLQGSVSAQTSVTWAGRSSSASYLGGSHNLPPVWTRPNWAYLTISCHP